MNSLVFLMFRKDRGLRHGRVFGKHEHNPRLPHSAFRGQTPDEMYFGTGVDVPAKLADARRAARKARLQTNRARQCDVCA